MISGLQQVAVHLVPHVKGDMLRNPVVQVGLAYADQVGCEMQRQGDQDQPDQCGDSFSDPSSQVFPCQHIDNVTGQDGRKQAADRRNGNAHQDQGHLFPVGQHAGEMGARPEHW